MRWLLFLLAHSATARVPDGGKIVRVVNGVVSGSGTVVGSFTSNLQSEVVDSMFAPVKSSDWAEISLINSTSLRYLELSGAYLVDKPLQLPSMFVLRADNATFQGAKNISTKGFPRFSALVVMNDTQFSAVIGGTYNASKDVPPPPNGTRGLQAISIVSGFHNSIRGVRAVSPYDSAIGINMGSSNEVAECDVGGDKGYTAPARCIWALATSRVLVRDNKVKFCASHALDFDAYTSDSIASGNLCTDNGEEGIFVEETASGNTIVNNTCRRNGAGIGVYSNEVGPVQDNLFISNVLEDNIRVGIIAGGYGHDPNKYSRRNIFIANRAARNGDAAFYPDHGALDGDYWVANLNLDAPQSTPKWKSLPANNSAVAIFEP